MSDRVNLGKAAPQLYQAVAELERLASARAEAAGLAKGFTHLLRLRASQINGCAFCLDMHTIDARAAGETEQRLYVLSAWREAPFYTPRERAALAWTESVTLVGQTHVPDEVYAEAREQFNEEELVNLTWAIVVINGWNRMNVAFRTPVGDYVSPHGKK